MKVENITYIGGQSTLTYVFPERAAWPSTYARHAHQPAAPAAPTESPTPLRQSISSTPSCACTTPSRRKASHLAARRVGIFCAWMARAVSGSSLCWTATFRRLIHTPYRWLQFAEVYAKPMLSVARRPSSSRKSASR